VTCLPSRATLRTWRHFEAALRHVHFANQTSHSSQECDCFPGVRRVTPTPVIAVPLACWTATACTMHAAHFPAPDSGRSTSCSSAFRGSVAPWCLFHEVDQMHGVVVHFPVSLSLMVESQPQLGPIALKGIPRIHDGATSNHSTAPRFHRRRGASNLRSQMNNSVGSSGPCSPRKTVVSPAPPW
jgi:hypothetical protein